MSQVIKGFTGLHNMSDPKALPLGALTTANNVDISREGFIRRRNGYSKVVSGTSITSSYVTRDASRMFIIDNGALKLINSDLSTQTLATGLPTTQLFWDDASGYVFISCGKVIYPDNSVQELTIPDPAQPTVTVVSGHLSAGRYQVAVTYQNSAGREGPASLPFVCDVPDSGGLLIEPIFESPFTCCVYVSVADGDLLYRAGPISAGSFLLESIAELSEPIDDRQIGTTTIPSGFSHIAYYEGRLYGTTYHQGHSFVWFSQDYWWNIFDAQQDYITVVGHITCLKSTPIGLVIGTDSELWVYTNDSFTKLADYGVPEGRGATIDSTGTVFVWTKRGVCTLPFQNVMETKLSLPPGAHVSTSVINDAGQKRLVVLSDDQGSAYNAF